jgi:hypothetical protein
MGTPIDSAGTGKRAFKLQEKRRIERTRLLKSYSLEQNKICRESSRRVAVHELFALLLIWHEME